MIIRFRIWVSRILCKLSVAIAPDKKLQLVPFLIESDSGSPEHANEVLSEARRVMAAFECQAEIVWHRHHHHIFQQKQ